MSSASTCALSPAAHPVRVFIEDTDCFGVVYYANYLRYFERAAASMVGTEAAGAQLEEGLAFGLTSAHGLKIAAPARLGDACVVRSTALGIDGASQLAVRATLVREHDGLQLCSCDDLRLGFVRLATGAAGTSAASEELLRNAAREWGGETESWAADSSPAAGPSDAAEPPARGGSPSLSAALLADEAPPLRLQFDEAGVGGGLTLHAACRYFERHRTECIGGPSALAELQRSGVNVVVVRTNGLRLLPAAAGLRVGAPLDARCRVGVRGRRSTQVSFEQWLVCEASGQAVARADVTCVCLDAATGRIAPAPADLVARLAQLA